MVNQQKWDYRFLCLAKEVASWSKDPSTKVGAVIADSNNRILSVGYNGFPKGVIDNNERYSNRDLKYKLIVHAEKNALLFANSNVSGATIYTTIPPCSSCAGMIIQSGINRVVSLPLSLDQSIRWKDDIDIAELSFKEAGVEFCIYSNIKVLDPHEFDEGEG